MSLEDLLPMSSDHTENLKISNTWTDPFGFLQIGENLKISNTWTDPFGFSSFGFVLSGFSAASCKHPIDKS